jgi:hypothetical protein
MIDPPPGAASVGGNGGRVVGGTVGAGAAGADGVGAGPRQRARFPIPLLEERRLVLRQGIGLDCTDFGKCRLSLERIVAEHVAIDVQGVERTFDVTIAQRGNQREIIDTRAP